MTEPPRRTSSPEPRLGLRHARANSTARRLQRLGVAGFLFFLLKGLAWLAIPALVCFGG